MSKNEFQIKKRRLDLQRIWAYDKLLGKIGILIGALIFLIALVVTLLRNGVM